MKRKDVLCVCVTSASPGKRKLLTHRRIIFLGAYQCQFYVSQFLYNGLVFSMNIWRSIYEKVQYLPLKTLEILKLTTSFSNTCCKLLTSTSYSCLWRFATKTIESVLVLSYFCSTRVTHQLWKKLKQFKWKPSATKLTHFDASWSHETNQNNAE